MKKQTLFLLSTALLLTGCQQVGTNIEKADQPIMTIGSTTYTKGDEYSLLKHSSGAKMSVELIRQAIMDKEIKRTDEIKKEAEKQYDQLAQNNPDIETQLQQAGYKDKTEYIDKVLIPSVQSNKLIDTYFIDAKEKIKKEYKPSLVKIIQCDDEKTAQKALDAYKDGVELDKIYEEYASPSATYTNQDTLITTSSTDLPTRLINTMAKQKKAGIANEIFKMEDNETATTAYVAILVNNNYDNILEQIKQNLSTDSTISTQAFAYFLEKYNFEVHDQFVFDYLKANNPEYLYQYPELTEDK